jgi:hypothetical protein
MTLWIAAVSFAVTLALADVSGSWTGTLSPEGKDPDEAHFVLRQEGGTVTGTAGGGGDDERLPIRNGTVKDGVVTFEVETPNGYLLKFVLKEQGDELSGTATRERDGRQDRATVMVKRTK